MSRRRAAAHHAAASQPSKPYTPSPDPQTFRDLLIFEERLKQSAARMNKRKSKYQTLLVLLIAAIAFLSYHVMVDKKEYLPLHYLNVGLLLLTSTTLFLFFASGMYDERITAANKFVSQANRSLRSYNMYLNTRTAPRKTLNPLTWFASSDSPQPHASSAAAAAAERVRTRMEKEQQQQRAAAEAEAAAAAAASAPSSPVHQTLPITPLASRRSAIPVMPPSQNPRGELIFSARVAPSFREGYERYRAAFERRRKERLLAKESRGWRRWWNWLRRVEVQQPAASPAHAAKRGKEVGSPNVGRSRTTSAQSIPPGVDDASQALQASTGAAAVPTASSSRAATRRLRSDKTQQQRATSSALAPPLELRIDTTTGRDVNAMLSASSSGGGSGSASSLSDHEDRMRELAQDAAPPEQDRGRPRAPSLIHSSSIASLPADTLPRPSDTASPPQPQVPDVLAHSDDRTSASSTLREPESEAPSAADPKRKTASAPASSAPSPRPLPLSLSTAVADEHEALDVSADEEWVEVRRGGRRAGSRSAR